MITYELQQYHDYFDGIWETIKVFKAKSSAKIALMKAQRNAAFPENFRVVDYRE